METIIPNRIVNLYKKFRKAQEDLVRPTAESEMYNWYYALKAACDKEGLNVVEVCKQLSADE